MPPKVHRDRLSDRATGSTENGKPNDWAKQFETEYASGLISNHFLFRKKKFWNAAIASGERIRSLKK